MHVERTMIVRNVRGVHSRVATRLHEIAAAFPGDIFIQQEEQKIRCDSVLAILGLGLEHGAEVQVRAEGTGAAAALDAVCAILDQERDP